MKLRINNIFVVICLVLAFFAYTSSPAYAVGPVVSGKVVISGSNAPVAGVWVKWNEDFGTPFQSAYQYAKTDINGVYSFNYWPDTPPGPMKNAERNAIDSNSDGAADDVQVFIDPTKPIPGNPNPSDAQHFDSINNPHSFTAIVPAGWSGTFSAVGGVVLNNLAGTITNADIVFTASSVTPTPAPTNIYTISGTAYTDTNKNGILDVGETGFAGIQVSLTGLVSATTTTDVNGNYSFTGLNPGNYSVTMTEPSGYRATSALSSNVTLSTDTVVNFGLIKKTGVGSGCTASVNGVVFNDTSKDGVFDVGETPLSNWAVTITSVDLPTPLTVMTDINGNYSFGSLCTGNYTVTHTVPSPWVPTTQIFYTLSVLDGSIYNNNNFGVNKIFDISGTVFVDSNSNKVKDAGEPSLAGITILLSGPVFASGTSDVNGQYLFKGLPVGNYVITVIEPAGNRSTTPNYLNVNLSNDKTINFGFTNLNINPVQGKCASNAVDFVIVFDHSSSMNEPDPASGQPKIDVARAAASAFVGLIAEHVAGSRVGVIQFANSSSFPNNPTVSGIVSHMSTNYTQIQTDISNINQSVGTCFDCGLKLGNDLLQAEARPNVQKIIILMTDGRADDSYQGGDPENDGMVEALNGVNGQNIIYDTIGIGDPVNDVNGAYLQQLANTNGGKTYNDPTNGQLLGIFNSIANSFVGQAVLSGNVFNDLDANLVKNGAEGPLANWIVTLTGGTLAKPLSLPSDAAGNYLFNVLCDGVYTATETIPVGWVATTPSSYSVNSANGGSYPNLNFGNIFGYRISGNIFMDYINLGIFDPVETRHPGAFSIASSRGNVTTHPDGTYIIDSLLPGLVTVSYTSLPSGYFMTSPLNGPPPSFQVIVGPGCNTNGAPGAKCQ